MRDLSYAELEDRVKRSGSLIVFLGILAMATLLVAFNLSGTPSGNIRPTLFTIGIGLCAVAAWATIEYVAGRSRRDECLRCSELLRIVEHQKDISTLRRSIQDLDSASSRDPLVADITREKLPKLRKQLDKLEDVAVRNDRSTALRQMFPMMRKRVDERVDALRRSSEVLRAREIAVQGLARAKQRREQLERDTDAHVKTLSWWNQFNFDYPDYRQMDGEISKLERQVNSFLSKTTTEARKAEADLVAMKTRATDRLAASECTALEAVPHDRSVPFNERSLASSALWLGALSVPVSIWSDVARSGEVFDALRSVNGNYAGLNDIEIWMQTLLLPAESLAGLTSLTKGALFEKHVAETTGGELHEYFNTPDTDIIIDGTAYQIKATDSEAYIDTVSAEIPVIATSEVAETAGVIDGGLTNAELESVTEIALGGTVIDISDTFMDAALAGAGGLGVLATLRGINHTISSYREGSDGVGAIAEGVGVAVTGTMKATVDLAETGYKIVTSTPSRFVGRQTLRVAAAVGRAMVGPDEDETGKTQKDKSKN